MKCHQCNRPMKKIDRRDEMADLDEDVTDGQMADYLAAELSGDNGEWNLGIVEYCCSKCDLLVQVINDQLTDYDPLIRGWHEKAASGDSFSRFVFQYLSFIAYIKNKLFYEEQSDRRAIQRLKQDDRIRNNYLLLIHEDKELGQAWGEIREELERQPLHNSSADPDYPEIDKWWNSDGDGPSTEGNLPRGKVLSVDDWGNMVEFWYGVRNNLFHGGKNPSVGRDIFLIEHAFRTLRPLMKNELHL